MEGFGGKTGPFPTGWVFRVLRPIATFQFRVPPDPEPTREFGPVASITFTVSLPLPILRCVSLPLRWPLYILCSILFPGPFPTALRVLLTVGIVIVIAIARTSPSTAQHSGIRPVLIIISLVDYLIPIQWSNGQEVAWLVLPAACWLNLCPESIATIPRETLIGEFNLPQAGCLRIGAIDLIAKGTGNCKLSPFALSGFIR